MGFGFRTTHRGYRFQGRLSGCEGGWKGSSGPDPSFASDLLLPRRVSPFSDARHRGKEFLRLRFFTPRFGRPRPDQRTEDPGRDPGHGGLRMSPWYDVTGDLK